MILLINNNIIDTLLQQKIGFKKSRFRKKFYPFFIQIVQIQNPCSARDISRVKHISRRKAYHVVYDISLAFRRILLLLPRRAESAFTARGVG
jgi:hypothetical protein